MAEYLVKDFFPATSTLINSHFPALWNVAFPPSLRATDAVPNLHIYPSIRIRWPLLVPLCTFGMLSSANFALRFLWAYMAACASYKDRIYAAPHKTDECCTVQDTIQDTSPTIPLIPAQTTTLMLMWALAYIWYGLMCATAMVYHCFHPLPFYRNMAVLCTSFSSLSIVFALSTRHERDDRFKNTNMYGLCSAYAIIIFVLVLGHPLLQEQLYLLPTSIAVGLVDKRVVKLAREGHHRVPICLFTSTVLISFTLSRSRWMRMLCRNTLNSVVLVFMSCDVSFTLMYFCLDVKVLPLQKIKKGLHIPPSST